MMQILYDQYGISGSAGIRYYLEGSLSQQHSSASKKEEVHETKFVEGVLYRVGPC